ncbi:hypothetical protein KUV95_05455 [Microbulbifer agarilyticus]|uniref:hypothetical protein n=1 Tax=Microbulbifer agarilyticus TaxID=260552 RepID=UPI001C94E96A|nr:hypothetical protein [Microbulbifer agarilyticus]MBY6210988.1 hypothetical protein [Microbulbifer agarilyticus]
MPPVHPVIDVTRMLNAQMLTQTPVTDTKAATDGGSPAAKGPSIKTLMIYDDGDAGIRDFAPILARAYYPQAKLVGATSLAALSAILSKYSKVDTLVIDVHSGPGYLLIGGANPSLTAVREALKKSGVTVQSKIIFEGCSIMRDPIETSRMVEPICGPKTQVTGFTYFSVTNKFEIDFSDFHDPKEIEEFYKDFTMDYMLPGLPSAKDSTGKVVTHGRRWFRDTYDETLPEDGNFLHIESLETLKKITVNTADEALAAQSNFSGPVFTGAQVTVTNVTAVAGAAQKSEALAEP